MVTKKTTKKAAKAPGLKDKTIVFDTWLAKADPKHFVLRIDQLGGRLASTVDEQVDLVVYLHSRAPGKLAKQAKKLAEKGASIEVLSDQQFCQQYGPSSDEFVAMLQQGQPGHDALATLARYHHPVASFAVPRIERAKLQGMTLNTYLSLRLDHCDLSNADLRQGSFHELTNCNLRGAKLANTYVGSLEGSDCRETDIRNLGCNDLSKADLRQLDLSEVDWSHKNLQGANLTKATLERATLCEANLAGATLSTAKLSGADLSDANLSNSDLRRAKLVGANLGGADLTGANLAGADFTDATIHGANLPDPLPDGIRGLDPNQAKEPKGQVDGPKLSALDAVARTAKKIKMTATVELPDGTPVHLELTTGGDRSYTHTVIRKQNSYRGGHDKSLTQAMLGFVRRFGHGTLQVDSIHQQSSDSPIKGKELTQIAVAAWCESFGVDSPFGSEEPDGATDVKGLLKDLGSKGGVARFNEKLAAMGAEDKSLNTLDFGGLALDGLKAEGVDLSLCRFKGSSLQKARLVRCKLDHASFEGATLKDTVLEDCSMKGTNWTGGKISSSRIVDCQLVGATFTEARFHEVVLTGSELDGDKVRGASFVGCDLSGANLSGLAKGPKFEGGKFDANTRFPPQFKLSDDMEGPREADGSQARADTSMDLTTFMTRLRATVHSRDLQKALKMLRGASYHLYSMVDDDQVVSIVKSPSDPKRFYACRLGESVHSCGTQRLNRCSVCGRGPCKHMLVMIVGLARTEQVDLAKLDRWVQTSMNRYAEFDKDQLADLFLRYSNAQAGEIDWRPTETIPEDYYSI